MLQAFVFNEMGILVRHWFEIDLQDSHMEHGARIELRLTVPRPHRGSESAAQHIQLDQPVWRADLFDRLDGSPGQFDAAHVHPYFSGVEPCQRHWVEAIKADPWRWLEQQLSDLPAVLAGAGVQLRDPVTEADDVHAHASEIVTAATRRAPTECRSARQCHAWTSDVDHAVQLMLDTLQRPDLLDRDRASPWLQHA